MTPPSHTDELSQTQQGRAALPVSAPAQQDDVPVVSVRDLVFRYPTGTVALDRLSMSIRPGEIVGVVGPSGCGKSTLLRAISGLRPASSGTIEVRRGPGSESRPALGMLFQEDTLVPWMKVYGNAGLYFKFNKGFSREEVRQRVDELLDMVGLSAFRDAYPGQLSGGMRRRAALVAAVAPHPQVLLLDEPFSALDEPTRVAVHRDVLTLIRAMDITCCLVTHDLGEAITLCDRVLVLSGRPGRVIQSIDIDLGRDRDLQGIRATPRFLELYGQLWNLLQEQTLRSSAVPAE
jgi:NitT/TauT family transport system ATP-binding protein